jgi:uncharacterized membrane protein
MALTPEERKRIYEEEKAKIDAQAKAEKQKNDIPLESSTTLAPRLAGFLCYLGVWISGIVFLVIEKKNRWVRFHAAQSIVTFGTLWIGGIVLGWIPFIGGFFSFILGVLGVILWIVLMVKAYNGERYKLPWAGDIAEMILSSSSGTSYAPPAPPPQAAPQPPNAPQPPQPPAAPNAMPFIDNEPVVAAPQPAFTAQPPPPPPASPAFVDVDEKTNRKIDDWFSHRHEGHITASAFAIAWDIILLVFFNFFNQYVAYYNGDTVNGLISWTRQPFFTSELGQWLPILNTALAVSIFCHIVMIVVDKDLLRQALHVIMDGFGLAVVITLLVVWPFDFSVIPNHGAETGITLGISILLIVLAVGIGIGLLVKFIKLLISSLKVLTRTS